MRNSVTPITPAPTTLMVELAIAAWDAQHPAATDNPEWRHLLNEVAHPETTAALYALAERSVA